MNDTVCDYSLLPHPPKTRGDAAAEALHFPIFHAFSHLTGTVGLPIVNHAYHGHGQTLTFGARRPANFEVTVFED